MCIIIFCFSPRKEWKLVMVSIRDEDYDRTTKVATYYPEEAIIGSLDIIYSGMQIGVTLTGKIAAVTNLVDYYNSKIGTISRGLLVTDYLTDTFMLDKLASDDINYKPFNLFCAMITDDISYAFYRQWMNKMQLIAEKEFYGLGNINLNENTFRINRAKELFQYIFRTFNEKNILIEKLFEMMNDNEVGMEGDSVFKTPIKNIFTNKTFGTRTQTIILIDNNNKLTFVERNLCLDSLVKNNINELNNLPKNIKHKSGIVYYNTSEEWIENLYEFTIK